MSADLFCADYTKRDDTSSMKKIFTKRSIKRVHLKEEEAPCFARPTYLLQQLGCALVPETPEKATVVHEKQRTARLLSHNYTSVLTSDTSTCVANFLNYLRAHRTAL